MDEDLNKNLNENNNLEEPETKEPIDETLESVTADKTRDVEGTNLGNNNKGAMESGVLDRNAVLNEFDKLMMSPEYKQYRNLISGLEMDETSLLTKICSPKLLSTYEPGQESLAAREVFAMMSYMGAREAAIKRITSPKFDRIDLNSDNVVGIPEDIIEQKGMEEEVDAAVTDPDYNREVLGSTNILFSIKNNMVQAIDLTDIAALEGIQRMLQKMEEDINRIMKTMSKPRTTIPEAEAKRLKELYDEAIKAKSMAEQSVNIESRIDKKDVTQSNLDYSNEISDDNSIGKGDVQTGNDTKEATLDENKQPLLEDSFNKVKGYSNEQGKPMEGMVKSTVKDVELDALKEKERAAQEKSNRDYIERQSQLDEHNDRNDIGEK